MININTNYAANFAANAAKRASSGMDSAMEKLSTGSRINYARDDAAGSAIATRLTAEIQGLAAASRNASDGQSMIDTAEGALQETSALLLRMRELAVQAANSTATTADKKSLDAEFQHLSDEIGRIATNTSWSGQKLLDGSFSGTAGDAAAVIHAGTGATANDKISVTIALMSDAALSVDAIQLSTAAHALSSITAVDVAIAKVSDERNKLGAASNRLSSTIANLDQVSVNLSASRARVQDADFAVETGNLARNQIMQQAATAMLAQANASKGSVLSLIQN
jgi:flagellin